MAKFGRLYGITSAHNSRKLGVFPRPQGGGIHGYLFLLFLSEIIKAPLALESVGKNPRDRVVPRPEPDEQHPQNLCLDAGYTGSENAVKQRGYTPHIRPRGEEKKELQRSPDFHAHRWVVEVTHSFFNRFRKLLVRFKKRLPITWLCCNLPVLSLSGASSFLFIGNFGIGFKPCRAILPQAEQ